MLNGTADKQKLIFAFNLIVVLVWIKFAVLPWHDWQNETLQQIRVNKINYRDPSQYLSVNAEIKDELDGLSEKKGELEKKLFAVNSVDDFDLALREYMENAIKEKGINITRSASRDTSNTNGLLKSSFQVFFITDPKKASDFLSTFEKGDKAIRVEQLNVSKNARFLEVSMVVSAWGGLSE